MMKTIHNEFPLTLKISFQKLFDYYREQLSAENVLLQTRAEQILNIADKHPILSDGITEESDLELHQDQIHLVLEDLFSSVLGTNEIKIATLPYQEIILRCSKRYKGIRELAGKDFSLQLRDFDDDTFYIMGCSIILNAYYGYKVDFRRPFFYSMPDSNGLLRHYRVLYNGDFMEIVKTERSIDITPEDVAELLDNFGNVALWKEKFPPGSWVFKGFVMANMYDATTDVALTNFKENLLQEETKEEGFIDNFQDVIRGLFSLSDIRVGYSVYNEEEQIFEKVPRIMNVNSYLLGNQEVQPCKTALCENSYKSIFEKHQILSLSDIDSYRKLYPDNALYKKLNDQGIKSAIITPIVTGNKLNGVMEIVSDKTQELNSINANKLQDILPFLRDSVRRTNEREANELELIIQSECTSIHPSVHWKFIKEATRYYKGQLNDSPVAYREIVFKDVYPLFGQVDIKGSSEARNVATQRDLEHQLHIIHKIVIEANKEKQLDIYEQLIFRIKNYLEELKDTLQVDSERQVLKFLKDDINPLFKHLSKKYSTLKPLIKKYYSELEEGTGLVYKHRKGYDDTVTEINKSMASIIDRKQKVAQKMYPHYFERFKTDGVEHNLYIGESITKKDSFNKIYLYNLRLWQLQVMCEMENKYYSMKPSLPVALDVASMILVFGTPLALRFRMDEKRFDVDGTYNARYEVVKKRVDKAHIKGTEERITQAGKIAIVYSQKEDENEYLKYIQFLQHKKHLSDTVEVLEIEDLQGVTGLKAIRVPVLYNVNKKSKEYYTYEDLMEQINS